MRFKRSNILWNCLAAAVLAAFILVWLYEVAADSRPPGNADFYSKDAPNPASN